MASKELMEWTGLNCPDVTVSYLVRKISPNVTVDKWRVDSNAMFRHICGHQDPLTVPLNSLFDGVSKTTWVSIVMREFMAAREKTERQKGHFALIIGAAGTGKYTLAQIAHCRSEREDNPFLFVNCKAEGKMNPVIWSDSEREQFRQNVRNIMTLANKGTLYFHEIDHLDIEIQRELADILKTGIVVGANGKTLEKFNGMIICSTRHNIEELVEIDECAEELFQLINENVVRIPSISDFKDEIVTLANDFIRHICLYYNIECKELTNEAKRLLSEHVWGRNIRELYETVKHAVDLCSGTIEFLEEKLAILGLNEREAEEFIVYWLPKLQENKYNYIRFATMDEINEDMPLEFSVKPDTLIRVLMEFKGLDEYIEVPEQKLEIPSREGFVAVEWGGTELK